LPLRAWQIEVKQQEIRTRSLAFLDPLDQSKDFVASSHDKFNVKRVQRQRVTHQKHITGIVLGLKQCSASALFRL
jgi:hypothetical protein